jgi:hypothetical protein
MQPILIHCGELVTKRLVEILDNLGIAPLLTPVVEPIVARKQREKHARLYSFAAQPSARFASVCVASSALPRREVAGSTSCRVRG